MPLDTRRPFTRTEALAAGISPKTLRGPQYRRVFRGVYVDATVHADPLVRVAAALALHPPTAFASHTSAARVRGLPVPTLPDEHVTVAEAGDRSQREGIRCHVGDPSTAVLLRGLRVSPAAAMFVELTSLLSLVDLVVVGDALARRRTLAPDDLRAHCASATDRGARHARSAAGHVRAEVDSPMESRLRMLLVLAGLPEPAVNHTIRDDTPAHRCGGSTSATRRSA